MPSYGKRKDGTEKGSGYYGELKRPDGKISTELGIGVNFDGEETEIPALVPGLNKDQLQRALSLKDDEKMPKDIVDAAVEHAMKRRKEGKSPFADGREGAIKHGRF